MLGIFRSVRFYSGFQSYRNHAASRVYSGCLDTFGNAVYTTEFLGGPWSHLGEEANGKEATGVLQEETADTPG
jgi:hypothetical protein